MSVTYLDDLSELMSIGYSNISIPCPRKTGEYVTYKGTIIIHLVGAYTGSDVD